MRRFFSIIALLVSGVIVAVAREFVASSDGHSVTVLNNLETRDGDRLVFTFTEYGAAWSSFSVTGKVNLAEKTVFSLRRSSDGDAFGDNGHYTLVTYTGKDPDVSGFEVESPLYGKIYTFWARKGKLVLSIETRYGL